MEKNVASRLRKATFTNSVQMQGKDAQATLVTRATRLHTAEHLPEILVHPRTIHLSLQWEEIIKNK